MKVLDGKLTSKQIREEIKENIELEFKDKKPVLTVIQVGNVDASNVYIRNKMRACEEVGMVCNLIKLDNNITNQELLNIILSFNKDNNINGIIVQLPLPKHINEKDVAKTISPEKDVDCFNPYNVGNLSSKIASIKPCTPQGIIGLMKRYKIDLVGKHAVIINRSDIVGRPLAQLLLNEDCTVTVCHSKTKNLEDIIKTADILITGVGIPHFINANMTKNDCIIIDVSMNRDENNKLCGDVDIDTFTNTDVSITPVPGGVGPMTITTLLLNTYNAALRIK